MASIKISELNEYTKVQNDDLFAIVDVANGETKKVKAENIGTGGKELIIVGNESEVTDNTKLLIETDSLASLGTEVVDSLDGNETDKAPSVNAINNILKTTEIWSGDYYTTGLSNIQNFTEKLQIGKLYMFVVQGLSGLYRITIPYIHGSGNNIQYSYYDGTTTIRWRIIINKDGSGFSLDTDSLNMGSNTGIRYVYRVN